MRKETERRLTRPETDVRRGLKHGCGNVSTEAEKAPLRLPWPMRHAHGFERANDTKTALASFMNSKGLECVWHWSVPFLSACVLDLAFTMQPSGAKVVAQAVEHATNALVIAFGAAPQARIAPIHVSQRATPARAMRVGERLKGLLFFCGDFADHWSVSLSAVYVITYRTMRHDIQALFCDKLTR
jgi:hypothetical protein